MSTIRKRVKLNARQLTNGRAVFKNPVAGTSPVATRKQKYDGNPAGSAAKTFL
jgi:hypothetical protein